jgi:hypothetical protein
MIFHLLGGNIFKKSIVMADIFLNLNTVAALFGWFAWTVVMLRIYKDENEKTFNIKAYFSENWDNALSSLVFIPVLLYLGHVQFNFGDVLESGSFQWKDAYYVASGFIVELLITAWKKWKSRNS